MPRRGARYSLNGIIGFIEFFERPDLSAERKKRYIQIIKRSSNELLKIVMDIVEIAKIESCDLEINLEECSVNEIVEKTGVNRFSLYHEFTNKEGILYQSLNLYRDRYTQDKFSLLNSDVDLVAVLKNFYLSFLKESEPVQGCYFIHIGWRTQGNIHGFLFAHYDHLCCAYYHDYYCLHQG